MWRPSALICVLFVLDASAQPVVARDVFVVIGQSLAVGGSTQNQEDAAGYVTSPAANGLVSRSYRNGYPTYGAEGWILANDWPCDDSQCAGTDCTGANRTPAGHPDSSTTDGDGTCRCDCGVTTASRNGWERGSPWPAFAAVWMAQRNREVVFLPTTIGDSCIVGPGGSPGGEPLWDSRVDCSQVSGTRWDDERGDLWCEMTRSIANSGETPTAFLWAQGECDTAGPTPATKAQYKAALTVLVDDIWSRYERPTGISVLGSRIGVTRHGGGTCGPLPATWAPIREAQIEVIAENAHAFLGASYDHIELESDCTHIYDNRTWGARWADAVRAAGIPPASTTTATPSSTSRRTPAAPARRASSRAPSATTA